MSDRPRPRLADLVALGLLALAARTIAALIVDWPPYTDPSYYTLVATRLADGHGFTVPVIWSFLEVGGSLPAHPELPVASNGHWMPLTSIIAAAPMSIFGSDYRVGQIPIVILGAALVPMTYLIGIRFWQSRSVALASALLAIAAGPLLIMYPAIDNFAVFGTAGCAAIWLACEAIGSRRPIGWLIASGAAVGLATLARVDGLLLAVAPMAAWLMLARQRSIGGWLASFSVGAATLAAFAVVVTPWAVRNIGEFGSALPSAGGHTLWITSYNEQFSIGHEPSLNSYLAWGIGPIIGSKLASWIDLIGRTAVLMGGVLIIPFASGLWRERNHRELTPFLAYFVAMFVAMGLIFTFHAPKGAFYHSAPAWLPFAFPLAVANLGPTAAWFGRWWKFLTRVQTQRFLLVVSIAGALALSLIGSSTLLDQWRVSRERELAAASFLGVDGRSDDVILYSDPASMALLTGNPGVAAPFDGYSIQEQVVREYGVQWIVVVLGADAEIDPLGFWAGAAARDADGHPATFLPTEPAFEAEGVRIFHVVSPAQASNR